MKVVTNCRKYTSQGPFLNGWDNFPQNDHFVEEMVAAEQSDHFRSFLKLRNLRFGSDHF